MRKETIKLIYDALNNLFKHQDELNFEEFTITTLEALMLLERAEYLASYDGAEDSGNGSYPRSFRSLSRNGMQINIPRSRNGDFKSLIIDLIKEQKEQVNKLALLLYKKGNSSRDVSHILKGFLGESMTRETVNNLIDSLQAIREKWETQPLDAYYKVIYCDVLFTTLKRGPNYSKEAVYVIYGVKDDNTRELLLLEVNPSERSNVWGEYFEKLSTRGVEQVGLIVADGLLHFAAEAKKHYPEADIQKCVVHLQRNMLNNIRPKDKQAFALDLKQVFNNFDRKSTKSAALRKITQLNNKWEGMYAQVLAQLSAEGIQDYLTYIAYPAEVRRMIYATNAIENLNRQIRKVMKRKVSFKSENSLLNLIYTIIKDFEVLNWQQYPVHNFKFWLRPT